LRLGGSQSPCSSIPDQRKFARATQNLSYSNAKSAKKIGHPHKPLREESISGINRTTISKK
jgi:hypothetical protein